MTAIYPETLPVRPFTVLGCWPETLERYSLICEATDARAAETLVQMQAAGNRGVFWCCGVLDGAYEVVDLYTAFVDPADDRDQDVRDLEPDLPGSSVEEFTVFGIARNPSDPVAYEELVGERYADLVPALSPGAAEDVARLRLADRGGELWVCGVVPGEVRRADTYATFVDPDAVAVTQ